MQIPRLSRPGGLHYILNTPPLLLSVVALSLTANDRRYLASRLSNRRIRPIANVSWCLIPDEKVES